MAKGKAVRQHFDKITWDELREMTVPLAVSPALYRVPLKAPFTHYANREIPPEVERVNLHSNGMRWFQALSELQRQLMDDALRNSLIDILSKNRELRRLLQSFAKNLLSIVSQASKRPHEKKTKRKPAQGKSRR